MTSILANHIESLAHTGLPPALLIGVAAGCYVIGNINPAIIIGRAYGVDVKREGSGNAGMTNVMRTVGKKAGVLTFIIDVLKGFVPTLAVAHIAGTSFGMLCGVLVVVGHIWPAVYRFSGGKGVSTCFGVMLAFDARLALILLAIVLVAAAASKRVSAGTLISCACGVPISYFLDPRDTLPMLAIIVLIVVGHRENIVRLIGGTEPEMSFGNKDRQRDGKPGKERSDVKR
ncbi:MAG: glycerol-3-phosphate 1-O-acyltransferase PlsY [Clostridiales Family XIII bacterium]|jgi:glycerol-3-phosphate acyltransferase PlsY|nr:glycerol-3-phosphate 1-O-acyltransferase PlsY [Clostridiales Family XIII bacterium]